MIKIGEKDVIKLVITVILIIILLFLMNNTKKASVKTKELAKKGLDSDSPVIVPPQNPKAGGQTLYKRLWEESKDLALERDPFSAVPASLKITASSAVKLSGILWDKDKPLAVMNDDIVKIGDSVGSNTVVSIKKDGVVLNDGTKDIVVELRE